MNKKLVLSVVGVASPLLVVYCVRLNNKRKVEEYNMLCDLLKQINDDIISYTEGEQFDIFMKEMEELYNLPVRSRKDISEALNRACDLHNKVMDCI